MASDELSIVFGAGPLGRAVARGLHARGRRTRVISRHGTADLPPGVEVARGDAADPAGAAPLCTGASVIYHCASPPYVRWRQEFPALQKGILECAASSGARLIFGDNLYMYGRVRGPIKEDLPYSATGPNGRLRAALASMVLDAHRAGSVRAAIGRASDSYGPHVLLSHLGERVFGAALAGKPAQILGNPDVPHTFTFIDDFAEGLIILGDHERALGEVWHIPSAETMTARQFIQLVFEQAGTTPAVVQAGPRMVVTALSLFSPLMRALREQLYQLEEPFVVDHAKFVSVFGHIATPHPVAIWKTLEWFRARKNVPEKTLT